jgi:hypothetical protein
MVQPPFWLDSFPSIVSVRLTMLGRDRSRRRPGKVMKALVVMSDVIAVDELSEASFQLTGQVVVIEQDLVLHCLAPGWMNTAMVKNILDGPKGEKLRSTIPMPRSRARRIDRSVAATRIQSISYMTGTVIRVDGGYSFRYELSLSNAPSEALEEYRHGQRP